MRQSVAKWSDWKHPEGTVSEVLLGSNEELARENLTQTRMAAYICRAYVSSIHHSPWDLRNVFRYH